MPKRKSNKYPGMDKEMLAALPGNTSPQQNLSSEALSKLAKETGAIQRWRCIPNGDVLLRMIMMWAVSGYSFRSVAAWLKEKGIADIHSDSIIFRCRKAYPFLLALLSQAWLSSPSEPGRRILLFDATSISEADFKLHVLFDLVTQSITGISIDTMNSGESNQRLSVSPEPALVVADSHYGTANQIRVATEKGYFVLSRAYLPNLSPRDPTSGQILDIQKLLNKADKASKRGDYSQRVILNSGGKPTVNGLLIIRKLNPKAIKRAQKKVRRQTLKNHSREPTQEQMKHAEFLVLITTLPKGWATIGELLNIYRSRWQIELVFKRAKSIIGLDKFGQEKEDLRKVKVLAKLFHFTRILKRMTIGWITSAKGKKRAANLWRQCSLYHEDEKAELIRGVGWRELDPIDRKALEKLSERRRKRVSQTARLWTIVATTLKVLPKILPIHLILIRNPS